MTQLLDKLNIRDLSIEERIQLVGEIWDSIAEEEGEFGLTDAQRDEIDRRLESYKANPDQVFSWEEIKARLQASL
ncbi:MAG: addiction module protein [Dehalococcoidia bacterium]|nr:addiction module protein [Dehalococcoidia bacterium]